jgi:hypothetical protein
MEIIKIPLSVRRGSVAWKFTAGELFPSHTDHVAMAISEKSSSKVPCDTPGR